MRKKLSQKQNHGFTLVETLVAAGILAVLLAISAVGVVRARALLKITELDNAARSIYMAAENQAVLLKNGKRLNSLVVKTGTEDNQNPHWKWGFAQALEGPITGSTPKGALKV